MEEIDDIFKAESKKSAVTIGKFDGVHIGHMKLLNTLMKEKKDLESVVIVTGFDFNDEGNTDQIMSKTERIKIFKNIGIDKTVLFPLTKENAEIPAETFVKNILVEKLNCKLLVVGDNFRFGRDRMGDIPFLSEMSRKYDFKLMVIEREKYENEPVSSTRIRSELKQGHLEKAHKMLGRN